MTISTELTRFLISRGIIKKEDQPIYAYGIKLLLSSISSFCMILTIGCLTEEILFTCLYLFLFVKLRNFSGGYHFKSYSLCWICTVLSYILFLLLLRQATFIHSLLLKTSIDVLSFFIIHRFSPIENVNKPLSGELKHKNHRKAVLFCLFSQIVSFCGFWINRDLSLSISLSIWIVAMWMIPPIILNKTRRTKK